MKYKLPVNRLDRGHEGDVLGGQGNNFDSLDDIESSLVRPTLRQCQISRLYGSVFGRAATKSFLLLRTSNFTFFAPRNAKPHFPSTNCIEVIARRSAVAGKIARNLSRGSGAISYPRRISMSSIIASPAMNGAPVNIPSAPAPATSSGTFGDRATHFTCPLPLFAHDDGGQKFRCANYHHFLSAFLTLFFYELSSSIQSPI